MGRIPGMRHGDVAADVRQVMKEMADEFEPVAMGVIYWPPTAENPMEVAGLFIEEHDEMVAISIQTEDGEIVRLEVRKDDFDRIVNEARFGRGHIPG